MVSPPPCGATSQSLSDYIAPPVYSHDLQSFGLDGYDGCVHGFGGHEDFVNPHAMTHEDLVKLHATAQDLCTRVSMIEAQLGARDGRLGEALAAAAHVRSEISEDTKLLLKSCIDEVNTIAQSELVHSVYRMMEASSLQMARFAQHSFDGQLIEAFGRAMWQAGTPRTLATGCGVPHRPSGLSSSSMSSFCSASSESLGPWAD
eukprot:UN4527